MASILANIQSAARRTGLAAPSTLVTSPKDYELQYLENFYKLCEDLLSRGSWPQLKKTHTFTTTTADEYAFPSDFWTFVLDSQWDVDNRWPLKLITDGQFNSELYWFTPSLNRTMFRIFGSAKTSPKKPLQITPVQSGLDFSLDYISSLFIYDSTGTTGKESVSSDSDICVFPDILIKAGWRYHWLDSKGQDTGAAELLFERLVSRTMFATVGPTVSSRGLVADENTIINTPEGSWNV